MRQGECLEDMSDESLPSVSAHSEVGCAWESQAACRPERWHNWCRCWIERVRAKGRFLMILSDVDIRRALADGRIRITPEPDLDAQLGSVSVDFRLGTTFMVFEHSRHSFIDPRSPQSIGDAMRTIEVAPDEPFIMQPGDFALASTVESLELPDNLLGRLEGRQASRGWESRCIRLRPCSSRAGSARRRWS